MSGSIKLLLCLSGLFTLFERYEAEEGAQPAISAVRWDISLVTLSHENTLLCVFWRPLTAGLHQNNWLWETLCLGMPCVCVLGGEETGLAATWLLARQSILSLKMLLTCCRTDVELSFWKPLHSTSRETSVLDVLSLCIACPSMTKSRLYKDCLKFKSEEKCRDDV